MVHTRGTIDIKPRRITTFWQINHTAIAELRHKIQPIQKVQTQSVYTFKISVKIYPKATFFHSQVSGKNCLILSVLAVTVLPPGTIPSLFSLSATCIAGEHKNTRRITI